MMQVLLMVIELCVVMATEERILRILCIADPTWDPGVTAPEGFTSELSELSGFDKLELMTVLPRGWNAQECCHRFQIRFNADTFAGGNMFVPYVEWLPCGLIMTHVSCYGWNTEDGRPAGVSGSWWINVQQCIRQDNTDILHDIVTFSDSADSFGSQSSRWKGMLRVGSMAVPLISQLQLPSKDYACIIDGSMKSSALGFKHLNSIKVDWHTSLSFRVEFSLPEPTNQEIFTLHFQTDEQRRLLRNSMQCSNGSLGTSAASFYDEIVTSCLTLPLTASNAWAGCHVDNLEGRPTFTCHGGRNFIVDSGRAAKSTVIHIGVSRCSSLHKAVVRLRYRLEFLNPRGPCPGYSVLLEQNEAKHSARGASRAKSIRGDGSLPFVFLLLMSALKMRD
ncbi:hypothetical protein CAPTEDRAFT_199678 [Capitella teleta]|uniref:Uncharacterized protein n=1 Tax=Capitella teleta TaxID=283909 RepID=R7UHF6_CAPTE|nr:hypothetical protein CAPTEDRAFT_199678 [Capitella teleta]|eukprot:ELU02707.1 hypothetical protein CAPTEDRAFT_199678 [Capitella teleta]